MTRARDVANIDGILTTTGDTFYASAAATPARLGIGSTGNVLTVAGGVPSWAAPAGGKVVQIINAFTTTPVTSTTSAAADTGLTATITPTSASNKVLVFVSQQGVGKDGNTFARVNLFRGGTQIATGQQVARTNDTQMNFGFTFVTTLLDSPATTSATIYKTTFANSNATGEVFVQNSNSTSTITLMEVTP